VDDFEDVPARNGFPWPWLLVSGFLAGLVLVLVVRRGKPAPALAESPRVDLLSRIVALMEEGRLYLRKDLRLSDVAAELGTNATYVSACLNGQLGRSFNDFVASFRVEHAKRLLQEHPDMPLDQVADESGFPSERSFFRNFKLITGKTPSEWRLG
jgi:AraC-like DNA-binding protein